MEKAAKILGIDKNDIPGSVRAVIMALAAAISIAFTAGGYFNKAQAVPAKIEEHDCAIATLQQKSAEHEAQQRLLETMLKSMNDKIDSQSADVREIRAYVMKKGK